MRCIPAASIDPGVGDAQRAPKCDQLYYFHWSRTPLNTPRLNHVLLGCSETAMHNEFVDEPALCPLLSRVRVCDPFCIAGDAFKPSYGYRLGCVVTGARGLDDFVFDPVAGLD